MKADRSHGLIAEICFSISLFFYIALSEYLSAYVPASQNLVRLVLSFLSSIGFYFFVYLALYGIYDRYIYRLVNPILNISGEWHQIGVFENGSVRHGTVDVSLSNGELVMLGENYKINGPLSSSWKAETIRMEDREIIVIYRSEGSNRAHPQTKGEMVLHVHGSPPNKITGFWSDIAPNQNRGDITLYRDMHEFERDFENIRKGLGK